MYMAMLAVLRWRVGSTLIEDALPPFLFPSRYVINLWLKVTTAGTGPLGPRCCAVRRLPLLPGCEKPES